VADRSGPTYQNLPYTLESRHRQVADRSGPTYQNLPYTLESRHRQVADRSGPTYKQQRLGLKYPPASAGGIRFVALSL
jgi:hypothetical protein